MDSEELDKIINNIVSECVELKNRYIQEKKLKIDYVCIFSQSQEEYQNLINISEKIGKIVSNTSTGPVYAFNESP